MALFGFVLSSSVKSPLSQLALSNGLRPGLAMAAKTLADELGPVGIRVLGVMPGRIATARTEELDARAPGPGEAAEDTIPLRRYGDPDEFGRVAAFLLSPAASYLTGLVVPVVRGGAAVPVTPPGHPLRFARALTPAGAPAEVVISGGQFIPLDTFGSLTGHAHRFAARLAA